MMEVDFDKCKQELVENKKDLAKSKKLEECLRIDVERLCVDDDKLKIKGAHVEVRYDELVEKLKNKIWSVIFDKEEEEHVEASEIRKETDDGRVLDTRTEYFEEFKLDSEFEHGTDLLCRMFDGWITFEL